MITLSRSIATSACAAGLIAAAALAPTLSAQPNTRTTTPSEAIAHARALSDAFKNVASKVEPAVVHITSLNRVLVRRSYFDQGIEEVRPSGVGSGVIVDASGVILTNNHVVQNAESLKVRLWDGRELDGRVVGRDQTTDLAVVRIEAESLPVAEFADSDSISVGEWVVAIGSPFGLSSSVTAGIVSAVGRNSVGLPGQEDTSFQDFLQTDAAINPGNSGGPLLDLNGRIVGINSAIATRTGGSDGIGFAIPANMARAVMDSILKHGKVVRGWLGVNMAGLTPAEARGHKLDHGAVQISGIVENSPASRAGLREGDLVLRYQGRAADYLSRLRNAIALTPPGTEVAIDILRDGKPQTINARIGDLARDGAQALGQRYIDELGVTVRDITTPILRQLNYRENFQGVVVIGVDENGRASALRPRDLIVQVNEKNVSGADDFAQALTDANFSRGVRLSVIRDFGRGHINIRD